METTAQPSGAVGALEPAAPGRRVARRADGMALMAILVIAGGLRIHQVGEQSFWLDEVCTLQSVCGKIFEHEALPANVLLSDVRDETHLSDAKPWTAIWSGQRRDVHAPLYFLLLRGWMEMVGEGEVNVRFFSVLCSLAAIVLLYDAVGIVHGRGAAIWSAALMAVSGPQIVYAQEARMYALLVALGCAALSIVVRIEIRGATPARLVVLGAIAFAMVLTHYFAAMALLGLLLYVLWRLPRGAKWRVAAAMGIAAAAFLIVWGPEPVTAYENFAERGRYLLAEARGHVMRTMVRLATLPLRHLTAIEMPEHPAMLLLLPAWIGMIVWMGRSDRRTMLWTLWIGGMVLFVALTDVLRTTGQLGPIRYTLVASPAIFAVVGIVGSVLFGGWRRHILASVALMICIGTLPSAYENTKPNWRAVGEYLGIHAGERDALVFLKTDARDWYPSAIYLVVSHYHHPISQRVMIMKDTIDEATRQRLGESPVIWIFGATEADPAEFIEGLRTAERITSAPGVVTLWRARMR